MRWDRRWADARASHPPAQPAMRPKSHYGGWMTGKNRQGAALAGRPNGGTAPSAAEPRVVNVR